MRRWDRLQDAYIEEYGARGLSRETVAYTEAWLDCWGRWLKKRRPRIVIEEIGAETITRYIATRTSFRSKATVYATLSTSEDSATTWYVKVCGRSMRCVG
jgi:hypothetical protein